MTAEPTRERVAIYEGALGCNLGGVLPGWCSRHDERETDLGCPVAVAAARVEAERVAEEGPLLIDYTVDGASIILAQLQDIRAERDELRAVVEQVRALAEEERAQDVGGAWDSGRMGLASEVLALLPEPVDAT